MSDFTVDQLFRPRQPLTLGDQTVYVRALSDLEQQLANRVAMTEGGKQLRALRDPNSDEYLGLIEPIQDGADDELRASIGLLSVRRFQSEAFTKYPFRFQPFPENASEEEKAQTLEQRQEHLDGLRTNRKEYVEAELKKLKDALEPKDTASLRAETIRLSRDASRREAYLSELKYQTLFYSVEHEDGTRYFASLEAVRATHGAILDALYNKFQEVNDLDPLAWKPPSSTE